MTSFSIRNFGCRVNQAEAFDWTAEFQRRGWVFEPDADKSGVVVVNSCTLTSRADRDVRKFVRHVARNNPAARIVVTGCLAERLPAEMAALPGVWKIIPNAEKESLPDMILSEARFPNDHWANLENSTCEGIAQMRISQNDEGSGWNDPQDRIAEGGPHFGGAPTGLVPQRSWGPFRSFRDGFPSERGAFPGRPFRRRAFLKVQDGCDMSCAFCIIPSVRGRSRSVPVEAVRTRLAELAAQGFREVVFSGIHLSSYGRDLEPRSSLLDLLREIDAAPGDFRVRLSSLDPRLVAPEIIDHIVASKRIRPHVHLSLQHGSERVLKAMGRSGSAESYRRILDQIHERLPGAALGADIIVGFPGETDEDFRETREFLEGSPLTSIHVFSFSARPGTPAANRPGVDDRTRTERADTLRSFAKARDLRFRKEREGRTEEGVVISRRGDGAAVLTANAIDVRVPRCDVQEGGAVVVRIIRADERGTTGEIVSKREAS